MRLGCSHGDDEIISTEDAIRWFDIKDVGRAPARFDPAKLDNVNAHYIREADDARLLALVAERLEAQLGRTRSEERRGGKERRSRWSRKDGKKEINRWRDPRTQ